MKRKIIYAAGLSLAIAVAAVSVISGTVSSLAPGFLASAASPPATPDKTVKLTVTAKDEKGEFVSGAHVNIYLPKTGVPDWLRYSLPADHQDTTNAKGVVTFDINAKNDDKLQFFIEVSREDMQSVNDDIRLGKNFPLDIIKEYKLKPRPNGTNTDQTTTFRLNVVRSDKPDPVEGAKVVVWLETAPIRKSFSGQTDRNGDAVIVTPLYNEFEIKVSKETFGLTRKVIKSKEYPKEVPLTLTLEKQSGAVVTINVRDQDSKHPVGDADVVLDSNYLTQSKFYNGTTDGAGNATFVIPEAGTFAVRISQDNYESSSGAEARLRPGEEEKTFNFFLKVKPKKAGSINSIEVTVLQGDRVEKIAGYNLPLPDARVTVGGTTESTNRSGKVNISGDFEGNIEVVVEASGYKRQSKPVRVAEGRRLTGGGASVTFLMQPETSEDSIEVSVTAAGKNNEGSVPLAGVTVTAGGETTTTRADGSAKLTGDFAESVEVAVEKSGYIRQAKSISASGGKGTAAFTLEIEPEEDSVSITVMAQDPKGGSSTPVAGALVSANGLTATTDRSGKATITADFKNAVEVEVKAKDFVSQVQQVSIAKPERTGTATFLLQPIASLNLIVEVLDAAKPNNKLEGALVYVLPLGKRAGSSQPLAIQGTNNQGEAVIEIKGGADQVSQARSGLTLQVGKEKYKAKLSDIAAGQLPSSTDALRWTVFLERDWTDLLQAIEALEPRVLGWNNDLVAAWQASLLVMKMAEQAPKMKERSAAILKEIEAAGVIAHGFNGITPASLYCTSATRLRSNIQGYKAEADAKEKALRTALDNASALAASCSTAKDGDSVRVLHKSAIQIAASIGVLEKKALTDNNDLKKLAGDKKDVTKIIEEVEKKVAELRQEAAKAEQAATAAGSNFVRADNLSKSLSGRHAALTGEVVSLKAKFGLNNFIEGLPPDLDKRVETMVQILGKQNNTVFGGPDVNWPAAVQEAAAEVQADKGKAEALLARYKSATGGSCEDAPMDDVVQEIGATTTGATIELAAAGDLASKAAECTKRGACAPVVSAVRALLQQGSVQPAEAKISEARAQGCDVSGLDQELDYYKTLNEAVALLKAGHNSCQFQQSLDLAQQFPAGVLEKGSIRQVISDLRSGLEAQMGTRALLELARQAGVAQNISEQDRYLADAKSRASNYPCLMREVNNFSPVKGPIAPVDKLKVEEIPEDAIGNVNKNDRERPKVEEIPEDAVTPAKKPGNADKTGHRPPDRPKVEEIPDDAVDKNTGKDGDNRKPDKPGIEEIPDEERQNPGEPGDKTGKAPTEKKPKKPGGGFWENLGKAAGVVINEINKNKPPITGGDGGKPPPQGDTGTAGGGTGAGIPSLAGRWKNSSGTEFLITQSGSTFNWRVAKFGGYGDPNESGTGQILDRINIKATVTIKEGTYPLTGDFAFYQNGIVGRISFARWHWLSRIE